MGGGRSTSNREGCLHADIAHGTCAKNSLRRENVFSNLGMAPLQTLGLGSGVDIADILFGSFRDVYGITLSL